MIKFTIEFFVEKEKLNETDYYLENFINQLADVNVDEVEVTQTEIE